MSEQTNIEWTGSTWNPIRARHRITGNVGWHCTKPSAGCLNCYAQELNMRLGTHEKYVHAAPIDVYLDERTLLLPLRWKKPRKIFTCSMTDLFGEFVPDEFIGKVFGVYRRSASAHVPDPHETGQTHARMVANSFALPQRRPHLPASARVAT
jgi:protein gp37